MLYLFLCFYLFLYLIAFIILIIIQYQKNIFNLNKYSTRKIFINLFELAKIKIKLNKS